MFSRQSRTFCKRFGVRVPVIQAPMAGGPSTPALAAAVSNAGGLGFLAAGFQTPEQLSNQIVETQRKTKRPFGVNFFVHPRQTPASVSPSVHRALHQAASTVGVMFLAETAPLPSLQGQVNAAISHSVRVYSFTFGLPPAALLAKIRKTHAKIIFTVTTASEAKLAAKLLPDAIVAQGFEAGGHRGSFTDANPVGLFSLLPSVTRAVQTPVIAAGGITDGQGIAAALTLGASAAQLGTAFLVTPESGADGAWKKTVRASVDSSTTLTCGFTGKPARGIPNKLSETLSALDGELPPYPQLDRLTAPIRTAAKQKSNADYASYWSGQSGHLTRSLPATKLVQILEQETKTALRAHH